MNAALLYIGAQTLITGLVTYGFLRFLPDKSQMKPLPGAALAMALFAGFKFMTNMGYF
jgi:hypothetical protein